MTASVCGVIVTFEPDQARLQEAVARSRDQVDHVLIVENASRGHDTGSSPAGVTRLHQVENIGLSAAQNVGIAWARDHGHSHVLLLDQDSWPEAGMVAALVGAASELGSSHRVAGVGPRQRDPRTNRFAPFIRVRFPLSQKIQVSHGTARCDFLISSGTLIPVTVLDEVGVMDAGLFVDNIDLDWCFRARQQGYELFGVGDARMEHVIGDRRSTMFGGMVSVFHHRPERLYFIMRNRLALYRRPHTPRVWVAQDVPRVFLKLVTFGVFLGPRRENLRFMLRGLLDGVRGISGPGPLASGASTR